MANKVLFVHQGKHIKYKYIKHYKTSHTENWTVREGTGVTTLRMCKDMRLNESELDVKCFMSEEL